MARVITFSRTFPSYHPRAGEPTGFVSKIWQSLYNQDIDFGEFTGNPALEKELSLFVAPVDFDPKHHTIRAGHRWKVGDKFSPRVWSGKPYNSKLVQFAPDIEIKNVWDFQVDTEGCLLINNYLFAYPNSDFAIDRLAQNDGLSGLDLMNWFRDPFEGQIICWNDTINY